MRSPSLIDISDLTPDQHAQFEEGCKVMLPIERARLERVLARHLRQGTSKYAKSIPNEGIASVTLSLSGALWVVRAWLILIVGLVLVLPTHGTAPIRLVGFGVIAVGVVIFALGAIRLVSAVKSRSRFKRQQSS
ncbi:MAG: hypothetical protein JWM55_1143 [Acidimicrobiaceae bacterium]|nr:hypothetical protein [Acidimicrobiaceae bacterium]